MGVYLPNMEMPTSCAGCELAEHYERYGTEHYCPFMGWYADYEKCPLIPVPPHGRLGDLDALAQLFKEKATEHGGIGGIMVAMAAGCIDAAPTIIPAEEATQRKGRQDDAQ